MSKYRDTELRFHRLTDQPILVPDSHKDWEAGGVFNPGVIKSGTNYIMVYRAYGRDKISRLGYATSKDGILWRKSPRPIVEPDPRDKQENKGMEDPRIVKLNGSYYITYTAAEGFPVRKSWRWRTTIRILVTEDFKEIGKITPSLHGIGEKNDKDAVLFPARVNGQYLLLHRVMPDVHIAYSTNLISWQEKGTVLENRQDGWSYLKIGAAAPPLLSDYGWLMLYHGVRRDKSYALGVALLDTADPRKLTHLLPYPVLEPERDYEIKGVVPRVVFGTSMLEVGNELWIYYGAADRVIGVAAITKNNLMKALLENKIGDEKLN